MQEKWLERYKRNLTFTTTGKNAVRRGTFTFHFLPFKTILVIFKSNIMHYSWNSLGTFVLIAITESYPSFVFLDSSFLSSYFPEFYPISFTGSRSTAQFYMFPHISVLSSLLPADTSLGDIIYLNDVSSYLYVP